MIEVFGYLIVGIIVAFIVLGVLAGLLALVGLALVALVGPLIRMVHSGLPKK